MGICFFRILFNFTLMYRNVMYITTQLLLVCGATVIYQINILVAKIILIVVVCDIK